MKVKAYKVFNPDWTCHDFLYEVGKTYTHSGTVKLCKSGFHACLRATDCFNFYCFDPKNKVAEVELSGVVVHGDNKSVASVITIVRELDWGEVLALVNSGVENTGRNNTGNWNTGDKNTGYCNTGDCNTGDCNTGDWNTGDKNTGDCNTGYWNTGDKNTGYWNTGDKNTGDWNTGNRSSGAFCTKEPELILFNKPTGLKWHNVDWPSYYNYKLIKWVEGTPRTKTYAEMCRDGWIADDDDNKRKFFELPNFDMEIFLEIMQLDREAVEADYKRIMGALPGGAGR